jgi:putative nucleotidyltransferase with HDIG domain
LENIDIFNEIEKHLLEDDRPSNFLDKLKKDGTLYKRPFDIIGGLDKIEQEKKFHPEGNVWNHTMLVVDEAALRRDISEDKRSLMWSALLHDVGKIKTTVKRNGRWTAYDHDSVGAEMSRRFLREFSSDEYFNDKVVGLVRWHMQNLYVNKRLPFAQISNMVDDCSVHEIILLSLCDRLARGKMSEEEIDEIIEKLEKFVDTIASTTGESYEGIKEEILFKRLQQV